MKHCKVGMFQCNIKLYESTSFQRIPTVSRLGETGIIPTLETAAYEGRKPKIPQKPPGTLTPPMVSTPSHVHKATIN